MRLRPHPESKPPSHLGGGESRAANPRYKLLGQALKQSKLKQFFEELYDRFRLAGYRWSSHDQHRKLLDELDDVGGLKSVPTEVRAQFVRWMVLCFIGEPGG